MVRKIVATAIILFVVPFFVFAAETDNAASVAEDADSSPSVVTSYFQGVWVGSWPGFEEASKSQDFIRSIGKEIKEKAFVVVYSWEASDMRKGVIPAGKIRTEGTEQDDKFLFQYENKKGRKFTVTLQTHKDDTLKGRIERLGTIGPKERPYNETYLKRK